MKSLEKKIRPLYFIQLTCAVIGMVISLYLLVHHTRVKLGIQDSSSFCSFGRMADCDIVNVSRFSEVSGVPLASIGAVYFFFLLILGLVFTPKSPLFKAVSTLLIGLTSLALLIDLILLVWIQWLTLKSFCLLCILTYVANLGHLVANYRMKTLLPSKNSGFLKNLKWSQPVILFLGMSVFIGVISFLPSWIQSRSGQDLNQRKALISDFFNQWPQLPSKNIPISKEDASFGNPDAKLKIIVFSDFQCPFCRKAAFSLHSLLPSFKEDIFLTFKHFPLDSSCNPVVPSPMHPFACSLARLGVCAQEKNRFWDYHDTVFMKVEDSDLLSGWDSLRTKLSAIFTAAEFDQCLQSESSLSGVKKNVQEGIELEIKGTPATFVNGRVLSIPLDLETLKKLIELEKS